MRTNFFANFARDSVQSLHFADAVLHGMATRTMGIAPFDPGPRMAWDSSGVPAPSVGPSPVDVCSIGRGMALDDHNDSV